jgi:cytoskeletal protein CcmA (bactofilin family)
VGEARNLLVISEKARVVGKVKGGHVIINGTVVGPVECDDLLELQPKARIQGDVRYGTIEMHQGAGIDGEVRTIRPSEERPALKLAASSRL